MKNQKKGYWLDDEATTDEIDLDDIEGIVE